MTGRIEKRVELMRHYANQGRALASILHLIGIKRATAMGYARKHSIPFSDHKRRHRKSIEGDD